MILIIGHYLNFRTTYYNKFPEIFLKKLREKNLKYKIVNANKNEIEPYLKDTKYIISFEELVTKNIYSFFNENLKLIDMFNYFKKIEETIPIYPPTKFYNITASKKYLKILPKKLILPHTKVFYFHKKNIKDKLIKYQKKNINKLVIKCGYSGDADHVFFISNNEILTIIPKLTDYYKLVGRKYLVIIQPYNEIVNNRLNEYRFNFIDGEMSDIVAFGIFKKPNGIIRIPNKEINKNIPLENNIIKYAKDAYSVIYNYLKYTPVYLRIDVSYAIDSMFMDKYSIDNKRFYINEIENLDGTFYFNIPYIPKYYKNKITDVNDCKRVCKINYKAQENLANSLIKKIYNNI